jgi:DNA-binding MarR family transcriptional regulator
MLNDNRLNAVDVAAWGIMWDASRAWLSTISERRLGQRLRRSEDTARRIIRRLAAAGWIEIIDHGNGRCRDYRLLTPGTNARRSDVKTPGAPAGGAAATPSTDAPDPSNPCSKTPSTGAAQPRRYLDIYQGREQEHETEKQTEKEITPEQASQNIVRLRALATALCEEKRAIQGDKS